MSDETINLTQNLVIVDKINEIEDRPLTTEEEKFAKKFLTKLEAEMRETIFGGPVGEQRMTALRLRGTSFETVYLDKDGFVIEPLRCTCRTYAIVNTCPLHSGAV